MRFDIFDQPVTLDTDSAISAWNSTMFGILSHSSRTADYLSDVLSSCRHFSLGYSVRGIFYLLLGRSELLPSARESLFQSSTIISRGDYSDRDKVFYDSLRSWCDGYPSRSAYYLDEYLFEHPTDVLAVKLVHSIRFILGDIVGMRASIERVLPFYSVDHPARGYLLGCHAFTLEESGEYALSESVGLEGLSLSSDDAWGLHAVTHVYDMRADFRSGIKFLDRHESAWSHCNNFRYHVWWHKALMYLDLGNYDSVFDLYDTQIRADKTDDYRDIANATSLLSRLELNGIDVGDRWDELAELSSCRTHDGSLVFADLHYLLALLGASRTDAATLLLSRIERDAARAHTDTEQRMANPGLCAAHGLQAFSQGDYRLAFLNLSNVRDDMQFIGGSHAQRDIFERLTIDAGIRAGHLDEALHLLNDRCKNRGNHEDGYTASRRELIANSRRLSPQSLEPVPVK